MNYRHGRGDCSYSLTLAQTIDLTEMETPHTAVGACEPAWHTRLMGLQNVREESVHGHA